MALMTLTTELTRMPKFLKSAKLMLSIAINAMLIWLLSFHLKARHSLAENSSLRISTNHQVVRVGLIESYKFKYELAWLVDSSLPSKLKALGIAMATYFKSEPNWLMPYRNGMETLTVESNDLWLLATLKTNVDNISYWMLFPISATREQADNVKYIYKS